MPNAGLDHGLREGGGDGLGEALQTVHDRDQDVLGAAVLQLVHHRQPEFGTFIFGDPEAKNLALAIAGNAQGDIHGLVLNRPAVGIADLHP